MRVGRRLHSRIARRSFITQLEESLSAVAAALQLSDALVLTTASGVRSSADATPKGLCHRLQRSLSNISSLWSSEQQTPTTKMTCEATLCLPPPCWKEPECGLNRPTLWMIMFQWIMVSAATCMLVSGVGVLASEDRLSCCSQRPLGWASLSHVFESYLIWVCARLHLAVCFMLGSSDGWHLFLWCSCTPGGGFGELVVEVPVVDLPWGADGSPWSEAVFVDGSGEAFYQNTTARNSICDTGHPCAVPCWIGNFLLRKP
eukprot:6190068-Pleurochrysis_carterae.AAC.1